MNLVVFVVGPTGSGKSGVALALAKRIGGEIISCDSMQVYRGMDIGTAKPSVQDRKEVKHHLLSIISPQEEHSVFTHRQLVLSKISSIVKRGRIPILVGGSGFYIKTLIDGLPDHLGKHDDTRKKLEVRARRYGLEKLHDELRSIDPVRAAAIHVNDKKRVIRALEVWELSKKRPTEMTPNGRCLTSLGVHPVIFGLKHNRPHLYRRIEKRVDWMIQHGWIDEVKRLRKIKFSKTAESAIGYREIHEYLQGRKTLKDIVSEIKKNTRRLAKKQMTWFRKDPRIKWIRVLPSKKEPTRVCVQKILSELSVR